MTSFPDGAACPSEPLADGKIDAVSVALVGLAAVFGAMIGSFLNVVVYRVPRGESVVRPRSHCPRCDAPIRAWQNIPIVSYLMLRGRCAHCRVPISIRYPLVEAGTAVLFAGTTAWALGVDYVPLLPALLYLAAIGVALALIDIDVHRLPDAIVLPSYPVLAVLLTGASWWTEDWWALARAGIGGGALYLLYLLLVLAYPAGMGFGDVKLAGLLGAVLGYVGWSALVVGGFAGFLFGAVVAIVLVILGRGSGKTALPFGPFMLLGCAAGIVFGDVVARGYGGLLGV